MIPSKKQYERGHERHILLWDWCTNHPAKDKDDCPMWQRNGGKWRGVWADCFACHIDENTDCKKCPMDAKACKNDVSYFAKYRLAKTLKTRKKYAALIRDAKWTPYEEWIKIKD